MLPSTSFIKELYSPIQPAINRSAESVQYQEILPHPRLQHIIYCYWELKTTQPLQNDFSYRVVSDGCIDIYFELDDPADSYVMGFCKKFTTFPLGNAFHYFGIRFLPTMFPQLFGVNASELSNRYEKLDKIVPALATYIRTHVQRETVSSNAVILDQYFLKAISNCTFNNDNRMYEALHIILKNHGVVNIEQDLDTGISPRQLRRLFEFYVGDTAKTFCKVVRFQNILRAKPSAQSLRQNKLFFDAGYYDQAHFIREFKNFYGVTPSKAFDR